MILEGLDLIWLKTRCVVEQVESQRLSKTLLHRLGRPEMESNCYITIKCKYNSLLILHAGQLGELVKYTSRLKENKLVSNRTNLIRTSNKYCCKYNRVVLSSFGQTNQLTIVPSLEKKNPVLKTGLWSDN